MIDSTEEWRWSVDDPLLLFLLYRVFARERERGRDAETPREAEKKEREETPKYTSGTKGMNAEWVSLER